MKRKAEPSDLSARLAAYCVRVVRNAGCSAYRSIRWHQDKHVSLSNLPDDLTQLAVWPKEVSTSFRAGQYAISTPDDDLSDALRTLPAVKLEVVLRIFYLEQTECEAAAEMGLTRDNVHYHKRQALKLLRRNLEKRK